MKKNRKNAKIIVINAINHQVYIPVENYCPLPPSTTANAEQKTSILLNSFHALVIGKQWILLL